MDDRLARQQSATHRRSRCQRLARSALGGTIGLLCLLSAWANPCVAQDSTGGVDDASTSPRMVGDDMIDEAGRRFRVRFDPGSRAQLGTGAVFASVNGADTLITTEVHTAIQARFYISSGSDDTFVSWLFDNAWLTGWLWPEARNSDNVPAMSISLYQGHYHRHSAEPYIVFPSSPPRRLFFPFDVAISVDVGHVWTPLFPVHGTANRASARMRILPLESYVLLDPWRSGVPGRGVAFGVGVRYQIDLEGNPPGLRGRAAVIHRVAPFTAFTTRFRWQDSMGRTALEMRGDIHPYWSTEDGWHTSALTMLHFERILFAINDEPFAVTLDGSYCFHPSTRQLQETHEVRGTLGLSLLWQL